MDKATETALLDASPAPRVTDDKLAAVILGETILHRVTGTLTICVLTLVNGFTVVGKSACASPENYRDDLGEHFAREDAKRQIWGLEAYLLRERLYLSSLATIEPGAGMTRYIGTKAINAEPMTRAEYNRFRGWELPADENGDDTGYLVEYADGQRPNTDSYAGYVSWSPTDVFEAAYTEVGTPRPANESADPTPGDVQSVGANSGYDPDEHRRREALSYATHTCAATAHGDAGVVLDVARQYDAFLRGDAK